MSVRKMASALSSTELVMEGLVKVARPLLLQYYPEDSCVLSTRVAIEVLKRHGISARPLPVRVKAFNALANSLLLAERWEEMKTNSDAWSRAIGYDNREIGKFNGHLVAYVEEQYLVDLSISQISRPEKNLPTVGLDRKGWKLHRNSSSVNDCGLYIDVQSVPKHCPDLSC